MNKITLTYNSYSGLKSLSDDEGFYTEVYTYNSIHGFWVLDTAMGKLETLDLQDCTKPTQKAIKLLTSTIEQYYK